MLVVCDSYHAYHRQFDSPKVFKEQTILFDLLKQECLAVPSDMRYKPSGFNTSPHIIGDRATIKKTASLKMKVIV